MVGNDINQTKPYNVTTAIKAWLDGDTESPDLDAFIQHNQGAIVDTLNAILQHATILPLGLDVSQIHELSQQVISMHLTAQDLALALAGDVNAFAMEEVLDAVISGAGPVEDQPIAYGAPMPAADTATPFAVRCQCCKQVMSQADGCTAIKAYCPIEGTTYERDTVRAASTTYTNGRCPDCGSRAGYPHHPGCDQDYCQLCGMNRSSWRPTAMKSSSPRPVS